MASDSPRIRSLVVSLLVALAACQPTYVFDPDELASGHYFKRLTAIDMTWGNWEHHVERYGELL